ncbi:hypothetical protein [Sinomonas sp. P47F7]|uniref:hypothetical protein n=1 Tax=Sinomonas sp. P47F7 TaxID=3410987 RepID=UPI003BF4911E
MPNMSVPYARPDRSLLTLRDEVYAVYGRPARAAEFVTGYKSPSNFTGHNADSNGIVHAIDIFTDENGNIPEAPGRALAERLRVIGSVTNRFSYLIHDMSPGAPAPMIAGQFNGWVWQAYTGSDPHSSHIHVSVCDLYWGDPAPVGADVYDSTAPWGIAGVAAQGGNITPITTPQEEDMGWQDRTLTSKDGIPVSPEELLNSIDAKDEKILAALAPLASFIVDVRGDLANKGKALAALAQIKSTDPQAIAQAVVDAFGKDIAADVASKLSVVVTNG